MKLGRIVAAAFGLVLFPGTVPAQERPLPSERRPAPKEPSRPDPERIAWLRRHWDQLPPDRREQIRERVKDLSPEALRRLHALREALKNRPHDRQIGQPRKDQVHKLREELARIGDERRQRLNVDIPPPGHDLNTDEARGRAVRKFAEGRKEEILKELAAKGVQRDVLGRLKNLPLREFFEKVKRFKEQRPERLRPEGSRPQREKPDAAKPDRRPPQRPGAAPHGREGEQRKPGRHPPEDRSKKPKRENA